MMSDDSIMGDLDKDSTVMESAASDPSIQAALDANTGILRNSNDNDDFSKKDQNLQNLNSTMETCLCTQSLLYPIHLQPDSDVNLVMKLSCLKLILITT